MLAVKVLKIGSLDLYLYFIPVLLLVLTTLDLAHVFHFAALYVWLSLVGTALGYMYSVSLWTLSLKQLSLCIPVLYW